MSGRNFIHKDRKSAAVGGTNGSEEPESCDPAELKALRERVRGYVNDTVRAIIPHDQSSAYLEALARAPELVKRETDPLQFVRYCDYNVFNGCSRLCKYWSERKNAFGEERFARPLVLSGNGALTKEDILTLHAGYPSLLPDVEASESKTGFPEKVVMMDRRKWIPNATMENRVRCLFYIFSVMAEDDFSQVYGARCLLVLSTPRLPDPPLPWLHQLFSLASQAFPVKLFFHLIVMPHQKKPHLVSGVIEKSTQVYLQYFQNGFGVHVLRGSSLVDELAGVTLPLSLGGGWKFEEFFRWCQQRDEAEREDYDGRSLPVRKPRTWAAQTEEEKLAKRRMADLLHSRRKRERKREEADTLKQNSERLILENNTLKAESARLERLLAQAHELLAKRVVVFSGCPLSNSNTSSSGCDEDRAGVSSSGNAADESSESDEQMSGNECPTEVQVPISNQPDSSVRSSLT